MCRPRGPRMPGRNLVDRPGIETSIVPGDGCIKCCWRRGQAGGGLRSCFQKLETRLGARAEYCREQLSGKFRFDFAIVPGLSTGGR